MGGKPDSMFDLVFQELGGMGDICQERDKRFLSNLTSDGIATPEYAANTNPLLVKRIVESLVYKAGASEVYVFDHTCDNWVNCYKNSAIENMQKMQGQKLFRAIRRVTTSGGKYSRRKVLKNAKVHQIILETDVFINVPVLKDHSSTHMTCCMKNMMGKCLGQEVIGIKKS